jgi:hypothetical protein
MESLKLILVWILGVLIYLFTGTTPGGYHLGGLPGGQVGRTQWRSS